MFLLHECYSTGKPKNVTGKFQYGQVGHAKRHAEKDYGGKLFWKTENENWIGKDRNGKVWYHIQYKMSNPRMTGTEKSFKTWVNSKVKNAYFYRNTIRERSGHYSVTVPEIGMQWIGDASDANEARILAVENFEQKGATMKRKKNPERITQAWLDKRVSLLNDMLDRPKTQYTKTATGLTGNRGHLFIDHAYGGVKVAEMSGGGTGENNISDGYVPKKELNNFINGMIAAVRLTERKKNPITPGFLENFVYEMNQSGRDELKGALKLSESLSKDARVSASKRIIYKDLAKLLRKEIKKFDPNRNPKMRKKKRSAKQLANDKRLGRMAKARAAKKRGGRRKVTKRKATRRKVARRANPKRKVSAKSHLWQIFKCKGKDVRWLVLRSSGRTMKPGFSLTRGESPVFKVKGTAEKNAKFMSKKSLQRGWQVGVCKTGTSTAAIAAACKAGK